MLDDLFNTDNLVMFNSQLAGRVGLSAAIYLQQLINIQAKARLKGKLITLDDVDYFAIDRDYITHLTTLSKDEQLQLDAKLVKINILKIEPHDSALLTLDVSAVANLISENSPEIIEAVTKVIRSKVRAGVERRDTKRAAIIRGLKAAIDIDHVTLRAALEEWVDSVMNKPNSYLSAKGVREFVQDMDNYAKGNLDIALQVVNIAAANGWKNCLPAIEVYEKKKRYLNVKRTDTPSVPKSRVTLSDEEF